MHPQIVQGGMGVGISGWLLAKTVSLLGGLGVVTGVGLWVIMARVLQDGDPGGHYRRALAAFPDQTIVQTILDRYFLPEGRKGEPYLNVPMMTLRLPGKSQQGPLTKDLESLMVVAGFAEVWLAKEGHAGVVGINLLEKVQLGLLPVLYGAMLAGVDYVLMGAGLPVQIPGVLDLLAQHQPVQYQIDVKGAKKEDDFAATFDPQRFGSLAPLRRPYFFAIISLALAAKLLAKYGVDGWIIEGHTAGGHNAGPRGKTIGANGEPEYGPRDEVDIDQIRSYGLPYWLAGSYASPEKLQEALELGATGIQVGSIFALSGESGMDPALRHQVISQRRDGTLEIFTDPYFSPSGFPFKVTNTPGTITDDTVTRLLNCDIGILRIPYKQSNGRLMYGCPSEPPADFLKKAHAVEGFDAEGNAVEGWEEKVLAETMGRSCICNGLYSTMGCGQVCADGSIEPAVVTLGSELDFLYHFLGDDGEEYSAEEAWNYLNTPVSV
jgi:NAD(P)H-dependent flavin oxidoreductase YrpB (nitropropane dioxygenase family)